MAWMSLAEKGSPLMHKDSGIVAAKSIIATKEYRLRMKATKGERRER